MYLANIDYDALLAEDVPYFDLTSFALGIDGQEASIHYFTREDCVVCGSEEVAELFRRKGVVLDSILKSGEFAAAGSTLVSGHGSAGALHTVWKVGQNLLDHMSGIATKTKRMADKAHAVNPDLPILTTRKMFPRTKPLAIKAIMAGGAWPHRLGLSETVLVFKQHINLIGGLDAFLSRLPDMKKVCREKIILVEAESMEMAGRVLSAGADGVQFDKVPAAEIAGMVKKLKSEFPDAVLLAAGGVNENNIGQYAASGVSGVVTTCLYQAPPVDVGVKIQAADILV